MNKSLIFTFTLSLLLLSCVSVKKKIAEAQPYPEQINWPERYKPEKANFFVHNEIVINASSETVWKILIDAENWPEYYEGAANVEVKDSGTGKLTKNGVFTWKTMGFNFESTIKEFEPYSRLSWESVKPSIKGYHAWLIIPTSNDCKLVTEESQYGFMTTLEKAFMPNKLERLHQIWLEGIKQKAESSK